MTTTLTAFAGKQARNYSSNPRIDVDIIPVDERKPHCSTCGVEVIRLNPTDLYGIPQYAHTEQVETPHHISIRACCAYCGSDESVKAIQHAWYDAIECSRCGGVTGYAIGD